MNIKKLNISWPKIFLALTLLATVAGALFSTKTLANINKNIATAKEAVRPANVRIVKIIAPDCSECFNVDSAITDFKKQNIKVEEEEALVFNSPEASAKILQLGIKRIPTYIVTGEITKNNLENFTKNSGETKNNTFIFTKVSPIFIDADTKQEVGKVVATILTDPSCTQCVDPKLTIESLKKSGVKIINQKEIAWNSPAGQQIINQFKITKLPTFLLSSETDFYDQIKNNWAKIGTIEQDKTYVARNLFLPYRDIDKGTILGLVDLVYLTDSSCVDCYKVQTVQKPILTDGYGVAIRSERITDISSREGQNLLIRYGITKIPTILISPEVDQYENIKNIWSGVGIIGSDGWYIFTGFNQLGNITYKDLTNNQIINPAGQSKPNVTE